MVSTVRYSPDQNMKVFYLKTLHVEEDHNLFYCVHLQFLTSQMEIHIRYPMLLLRNEQAPHLHVCGTLASIW